MKIFAKIIRTVLVVTILSSGMVALEMPKNVILMAVFVAVCAFLFLMIGDPYADDKRK